MSYHAVDNSFSEEDQHYLSAYLEHVPTLPEEPSYSDELNFITAVQQSVFKISPQYEGLPQGQKRELKELYEAGSGLCYDRSRVIEKILRQQGFETRHLSLFEKAENDSAIMTLVKPGIESHAITEVLTQKGWLAIDSNNLWLSLDQEKRPQSMQTIQSSIDKGIHIPWQQKPPSSFYTKPATYVYGLYSRHGKFYPPYNFIPDVHYGELVFNLI